MNLIRKGMYKLFKTIADERFNYKSSGKYLFLDLAHLSLPLKSMKYDGNSLQACLNQDEHYKYPSVNFAGYLSESMDKRKKISIGERFEFRKKVSNKIYEPKISIEKLAKDTVLTKIFRPRLEYGFRTYLISKSEQGLIENKESLDQALLHEASILHSNNKMPYRLILDGRRISF